MGVTVRIPSIMRQCTEQHSEVVLEGATVAEVLEGFKSRFPEAGERFFSSRSLRYMSLFLNDEDVRCSDVRTSGGEPDQGFNRPVRDGDVLSIIFAVAGG